MKRSRPSLSADQFVGQRQSPLHSSIVAYVLYSWMILATRNVLAFSGPSSAVKTRSSLSMVRNIDLPEAIVIYGDEFFQLGENDRLWKNWISQCKEVDTALLAIVSEDVKSSVPTDISHFEQSANTQSPDKDVAVLYMLQDIWTAIHSITVQPKPFGGSSGFGAVQYDDPPRPPMPQHVVVLGTSVHHSRAARLAGMRVLHVPIPESNDGQDDALADAFLSIDELEQLWLEDIATPGSFWLNPPHPRDDEGNKVDPEQLLGKLQQLVESGGEDQAKTDTAESSPSLASRADDMDEEELQRILADLDPL